MADDNISYDNKAYQDNPYEYQMMPEPEDIRLSDEEYQAKLKLWEEKNKKDKIKRKPDQLYVEALLDALNNEPPESFIQELKVGSEYNKRSKQWEDRFVKFIPIDKVYFLLYRTFGLYWNDEIRNIFLMLNAPVCTVRLHCKVPNTNIWFYRDGVGAKALNQDSPKKKQEGEQQEERYPVSSLMGLQTSAVMLAAPTANSQAIKFASQKLGKLFGAHLDRTDYWDFIGSWNPDSLLETKTKEGDTKTTKTDIKPLSHKDLEF
jgi:hypothetical protein